MNLNTTNNFIHPEAQIGQNVYVGPFTYIDRNVVIGDGTWIGPNVTIFEGARIGKKCKIFPGAVIAGIPQDLKFDGEITTAEVGDNTTIREFVTINRGTKANNKTVVGSDCLIMAYAHVAHDCILGDHVILANNVNLAGHVEIEDWAIMEGLAAVQQFVRIGMHSFIAGGSLVRKNVPPYIRVAREPLAYIGINNVGLTRRNFSAEQISLIKSIYHVIFVKGHSTANAINQVEQDFPPSPEKDNILKFIKDTEISHVKGIVRGINSVNGANVYED